MARKKTAAKSALQPTELRVPAHGHGQLRVGNPGCKGGTGRPPNAVRAMMRQDLEETAPILKRNALNEDAKDSDRINAILAQARIGLPSQVELGENPENPMLTPEERLARAKALLGH